MRRRCTRRQAVASADGNGVFTYGPAGGFPTTSDRDPNYWADVVFAPDDTTPPAVSSVAPADGSTSIPAGTPVSATFNEPLRASSVSTTSLRLRTAAGDVVPAAVTYSAGNRTAMLTPAAALVAGGLYTATVAGVEDAAGNPLPQPVSWSFTIAPASPGPDPGPTPGSEPNAGRSTRRPAPVASKVPAPLAAPRTAQRRASRSGRGPRRCRAAARSKLRVACPSGELRCRVALRLRFAGHDAAERTVTLAGGKTRRFGVELSQRARRALARKGSLRVTAIAVARDAAGNARTTRTSIRLTPRR